VDNNLDEVIDMQKKWRKTGAALLIAGLTISGTSYVLAEGGKVIEVVDLKELDKDNVEESPVSPVQEAVKVIDKDPVATKGTDTEIASATLLQSDKVEGSAEDPVESANESTKDVLPEIPEGYTAGNLAALAKAYEQVQNPNAKASIKRNMERSIAKWESKQSHVEAPITEEKAKGKESVKKETVQEEKPASVKPKNPQAELNAQHKEERKELKAAQKAERQAVKAERKAAKEQQKQERKAAKEQQKQEKKDKKNNQNN
jgi:hypothetical protein